ncbi:hypothetical protein NQ176_g8992 [Zarea fungicola]|uniref:Uncharacterized protein n=1 Tax=Zarea fungicola TaxID=93591 RepID=A0ACC1MP87_9HYPO|nr:hypothetical protein NQ176_g8992 [Lecanicillium fungicola]
MAAESSSGERQAFNETKLEQEPEQEQEQVQVPPQTHDARHTTEPLASPPKTRNLPQWLDHFNRRDLTTTLRCTIAVWVASLLMLIHPSLFRLGQTTFLASLVVYLVPPAGNIIVNIIGALSLVMGVCLAWAWGLATMKAAQSIRSPQELQALRQALQQQVVATAKATGSNDTATIALKLVHDGFMLDARISAVYFVMGCTFIYFVSRLRYAVDKAILVQVFGIIATDIIMVIGPTLTTWTPHLPEVVVLPCACGAAIAIVCAVFIFPQSTSQVALGQIQDMIEMLNHPIQTALQLTVGATDIDANSLTRTRRRILVLYAQLQPSIAFMHLDLSRGRFSGEDVKTIHKKFQDVLLATFALLDLQVLGLTNKERASKLEDLVGGSPPQTSASDEKVLTPRQMRRIKLLKNQHLLKALIAPGTETGSDEMRDALHDSSKAVLEATADAVHHLVEVLQLVNMNRWFTTKTAANRLTELPAALKQVCARLSQTREACIADTTTAALKIHGGLFDEDGVLKNDMKVAAHGLSGLVTAFVIEERIISVSTTFEKLVAHVAQLLEERTAVHFWGPLKLGNLWSWLTSSGKSTSAPAISGEGIDDPDRLQEQARETHRRIQLVAGGQGIPKKRGNAFTRTAVAIIKWFTNPAGLYALRVVAATVATAIPAVIPHSAGFFYREKGLWTVVTAQTCVLMYMSDFTFSIFTRAFATIFGGVVALVIWYIGSGNGDGNPYGIAAAMPFGIFIFIWARLWLPQAYLQGTILGAATFALIIGYSWDVHHLSSYGLPGLGYVSFWKRVVTVLLGFLAALIVQMLPSPPSGTHHVAKTLANTLHTLNDHYALLVSHWGRADSNNDWRGTRSVIATTGLGVGQTLSSLGDAITMLKFETSLSPFDRATLHKSQALLRTMNQALTQLMLAATTLPMEYQQRFIRNSGLLDDISINNVMAVLVIAKQSLRTGAPLPARLPTPLIQTCYADFCAKHETVELHREYIGSEDYRSYCVALSSYLTFLHSADDLIALLKEAAGESHIVHDWTELAAEV